jgi:hypothetical protein
MKLILYIFLLFSLAVLGLAKHHCKCPYKHEYGCCLSARYIWAKEYTENRRSPKSLFMRDTAMDPVDS